MQRPIPISAPKLLAFEYISLCGPFANRSSQMVPLTRRADPGRSRHGSSGIGLSAALRGNALMGLPDGAIGPFTDSSSVATPPTMPMRASKEQLS